MKLGNILNKVFGKVFVMNLVTSTDRRILIDKECKSINLDYEIFESINGRDHYGSAFTLQHGPYFLTYPSSAGYMGCQMTYHKLLTHAIDNKLSSLIVLNDDCTFQHTLNMSEDDILSVETRLPASWDVIILGAIKDRDVTESVNYIRCTAHQQAAGSHGLIINGKVFNELKEIFAGMQWLGDGAIGHLIDIGKEVFIVSPSLCHQNRTLFSDINQCFVN